VSSDVWRTSASFDKKGRGIRDIIRSGQWSSEDRTSEVPFADACRSDDNTVCFRHHLSLRTSVFGLNACRFHLVGIVVWYLPQRTVLFRISVLLLKWVYLFVYLFSY
jgi:hypothetical protein